MTHSKESNDNLLFNEVRNLSRRLNEFQADFNETVLSLQSAAQDNSLDIEQLSRATEQLKTRLEYLEKIIKALQTR